MAFKIAVQMDPIEGVDIKGDSTFALMLEAARRGHELFYYLPRNLSLCGGRVMARGFDIEVRDEPDNSFSFGAERVADLADMDVVLLRQDPPFDMSYITTTHLLEKVHGKKSHGGTLVVNNPAEVRNAPEKIFVTAFGDLMPPTLISRDAQTIAEFRVQHQDIVLKPLYGNGGVGVFRLRAGDENLNVLLELYERFFPEPVMVQKFLPEVRNGDKRIIFVDGVVAGAINRVPLEGEIRSNMHVGGRAEAASLTARDQEICERLGPELKARGLIFVGIDVIGDYLTEINVTSPTGIREVKNFGGPDIAVLIWEAIESKLS